MIRLTVALCISVALLLAGCEPSGKFSYRDYVNDVSVVIDMAGGTLSDGHMSWPMKTCDERYYCIQSPVFEFAVPKKLADTSSWRLADSTYTIDGKRTVRLVGEEVQALLIEQQQGDRQNWFLYSEDKGLIGFGANQSAAGTTFFWLEEKCGFGGEQRC